ncbi:Abi family protein, partial [Calidifontibacillus erzurumensis]
DSGENGFSIIDDYNEYELKRFVSIIDNKVEDYIHVKDKIFKEVKNKRDYNYDTYTRGKFPIWKLIEMMSYGQLSSFIKFYVDEGKYKSKQLDIAYKFLHYSKNIRDSAAHSRPLLLNVVEVDQFNKIYTSHNQKKSQAHRDLKRYVETEMLKRKKSSELITNFRIHDLCCLIYLHDEYVKGKFVRKVRKRELFDVYKRALYRRNMYSGIDQFNDILKLFYGLIRKYRC